VSVFTAPVTHQDQGRDDGAYPATLSAFADQKIFGTMPCPFVVFQVSWFLATPNPAHGLVSKDADNVSKMVRTLSQSGLLVLPTPSPG